MEKIKPTAPESCEEKEPKPVLTPAFNFRSKRVPSAVSRRGVTGQLAKHTVEMSQRLEPHPVGNLTHPRVRVQ
jgi:hypothetical protein